MIDLTKRVRIAPKRTGGTTEILDLATVRGELETKLLDLGDASALQAHLRELCTPPPERSEPAPDLTQTLVLAQPQNLTQTCVIAPAPNLAETCVIAPAPNLAETCVIAPARAELDRTMYDGGALRDYARMLVEGQWEESPVPTTQAERDAPRASSESRSRAWGGVSARVAVSARWASACMHWRAARSHWSAARPSRKLVLALLPLSLVAAAAGTIVTLTRQTPPALSAPQPTAVMPSRRLPSAPARAVPPPSTPAPVQAPLPPPAASAPQHGVETAALVADPVLERAALRAAFDGNKREAIAAYERLAARPGGEPFKLAARLLREDRVRKP